MTVKSYSRATTVVAALLRRHPRIQYVRLRTFPVRQASPTSGDLPLGRALRHERGPELLWAVSRQVTSDSLRQALTQVSTGREMVGLCSRAEMRDGTGEHFLLMDFRCGHSPSSLSSLVEACEAIGYAGWLLATHQSYHFYGDRLVHELEWLRFMGRWLLLEQLADVRFIAHCVIERLSCLRLTGRRTWSEPRVVARIAGGG